MDNRFDSPALPTRTPGQQLVRASALSGTPLTTGDLAQLTREELFDYSAFFPLSEAEGARFNGAALLAYAVTWRSRLSAEEESQLNRRQREVYAALIEHGLVGFELPPQAAPGAT